MNRYENDSQSMSWISIRSLINESKINSVYSKRNSESSIESSSPSPRQEGSITSEWKPNTFINQSACFSSMHDNYCKELQETTHSIIEESPKSHQDIEALKCYIHRRDSKYRKLQRIYNKDVDAYREEISNLTSRLSQSEAEVTRLANVVEMMKKEHILQLQNLQARHERKLQKSKMDLNALINDISEKNTVYVTEKLKIEFFKEAEKVRDFYEEKIEEMKVEHELELNARDVELKDSDDWINSERFKAQVENIEKNYAKEVNNLKRLLMIQKEENKELKQIERNEDLLDRIKKLEEENEDLRENIDSCQRTIDELSKELSASFRKKKSTSLEDGLENDLQKLLGQINNYLDSSELTSSKDLGETLRSLQNKLDLFKSGKISL